MTYRQPSNTHRRKSQLPSTASIECHTPPHAAFTLTQTMPSSLASPAPSASAHLLCSTMKALAPSPWYLVKILPHPFNPEAQF